MTGDHGAATTIANEFAVVTVDKIFTRNGERLEIASPPPRLPNSARPVGT